jgi:hypothetical protein
MFPSLSMDDIAANGQFLASRRVIARQAQLSPPVLVSRAGVPSAGPV